MMDPNRAALLLSAIALAIAIGSAITSERLDTRGQQRRSSRNGRPR